MENAVLLWIVSMILPVTLIVLGAVMKKHYPKEPNTLVGFRTTRSMRSQEAWEYANSRAGQLMLPGGLAAAGVCVLLNLLLPLKTDILLLIDLIPGFFFLFLPVVKVEKELKARFDEYGMPKGE